MYLFLRKLIQLKEKQNKLDNCFMFKYLSFVRKMISLFNIQNFIISFFLFWIKSLLNLFIYFQQLFLQDQNIIMKLSKFRIRENLQKNKLQPLSSQVGSSHEDQHTSKPIQDKFSTFLQSFETLIGSLAINHSKSSIEEESKVKESIPRPKKDLDFRDRYVIIDLPKFEDGKIDKKKLEAWIGEMCQQTLSVAFHYFIEKKINYEQMKVFASQSLLRNLSILVDTYKITSQEIKFIDKTMDELVFPYLKAKYPLTVQNDVNKALQSVIEEIDNSQILANDYFFDSDIHFQYRQNGKYDDLIMRFINQLITKIDMKIPLDDNSEITLFKDFQDTMTNIFQKSFDEALMNSVNPLKESKTLTSQKQKQKYRISVQQYTSYSINRKISENTQVYSEDQIKSGYLSIKSSAILRILTKWCEELWQKFENQNYFRDRTDGLGLIKNKKVGLVFPWLKTLLTSKVKAQKQQILTFLKQIQQINYHQQVQLLENELDNSENPFIQKYERVSGKFACKIVNNIENFIVIYLNRLIHGLTKVSHQCFQEMKVFPEYWPSPYNLLSFKIGDLLRCKYSSKEKEVVKMFKQIEKISSENSDKIKIIRIKNRLRLGTNDILIKVKFNNTIACEIQLAVNSANSQFISCSNKINHYIYELQRSRFGPISQICSIWKSYDKRSKQFQKIIQKQKPRRDQRIFANSICVKENKEHEQVQEKKPFICSECNKNYYHNNYIVNHLTCKNCKYWKCAMCLIEENKKAQNKDFFLKDNYVSLSANFWEKENQVPQFGICIFTKRTLLEPIPFKKISHNFKDNLVRKLGNEIIIMRQVSSLKELNEFQNECVIFEVQQTIVDRELNLVNRSSEEDLIITLFIPEYIKRCLKKEKETISILREDHLTKVDFNKITSQYRQKMKSIKSIEFSSTGMINLDIISTEFINLNRLNINLNSVADVSKITQFKKLQKLYMNENQIKQIPIEIGNLKQLKQLDAYNNQISQMPESMFSLSSLSILNLSQNSIQQIPERIYEIQNLKQLIVRKNKITEFPIGLGKHKKLEIINLEMNSINKMPEQIEDLSCLKQLILNSNQIQNLPLKMQKMIKLSVLDLKYNKLQELSDGIRSLVGLQVLNLQKNQIQKLPDEIGCLEKLNSLIIISNKLKQFNPCIFNLTSVTYIDVSDNQLVQLADRFDEFKQLTYLNIEQNLIKIPPRSPFKLQNVSFYYRRNKFQELPLQILQLKDNEIQWQGEVSDHIKRITFEKLPTYSNTVSRFQTRNVGLEQFPIFLFDFENMTNLNLALNYLKTIPDMFKHDAKLQKLSLMSNNLISLPSSISNLSCLKRLQLQKNQLSALPDQFFRLQNLQYLDISNNKFTKIPEYLSKLQSFKYLFAEQNEIETLPQWIGDHKQLKQLHLKQNKIKQIPLSLCRNSTIEVLNLNSNLIEVIPTQINQMTGIKYSQLFLHGNPFKHIGDPEFILRVCDYNTNWGINDFIIKQRQKEQQNNDES